MWRALVLTAAVVAIAADPPKDDASKKDLERLQGVWDQVTDDGSPFVCRVVISGTKLTYIIHPGEFPGTLKIDATKKPATMDVAFKKDLPTLYGIYEVKGDTLRICFTDEKGKERPKEFDAKKGSPYTLWVFKRAKE
jgi:uncharacterized protein (TIGR03067 family)